MVLRVVSKQGDFCGVFDFGYRNGNRLLNKLTTVDISAMVVLFLNKGRL